MWNEPAACVAGETLSEITARHVPPPWHRRAHAADDRRSACAPASTPTSGWLDFQDYFVRHRCEPVVRELVFEGVTAQPQPDFLSLLADPALTAVVICPSNPFISVEPILALPGVRAALDACRAPIIAVSPIIAGRAIKGPTAKMMTELGLDPSARAVAEWYGELLDAYIVDHADAAAMDGVRPRLIAANTLMLTLEDREVLARVVLDAATAVSK